MGNCVFCGKPAGLFRSVHKECQEKENDRLEEAALAVAAARNRASSVERGLVEKVRAMAPLAEVELFILDAVSAGVVASSDRQSMLSRVWGAAVDRFLDDGVLSAEEESYLVEVRTRFSLHDSELNRDGALKRVQKSAVLRRVMAGEAPDVVLDGVPVNLQRNESPIWLFNGCEYLEDRVRREWQGGSQGVSLRVMSGVYYRVGAFKGKPVYKEERAHVATGALVITTKHLYFWSPSKSLRIPYAKIVSFTPYSNAIGVMRDAATAKAQIFCVDDAWFAYNLVTNLAGR